MSVDTRLLSFIRRALQRQVPREDIERVLIEAGWSRDAVRNGLSLYARIPFPVPVPRPRAALAVREAFVYILIFTTLYTCAGALTCLVFSGIDFFWGDSTGSFMGQNRGALSSLIVALPLFVGLSRWQGGQEYRHPELQTSTVRKVLTYITLLLTASILIADLISLVYFALGQELTRRFVLKSLSILALHSTIFWYYLNAMQRADAPDP